MSINFIQKYLEHSGGLIQPIQSSVYANDLSAVLQVTFCTTELANKKTVTFNIFLWSWMREKRRQSNRRSF